MTNTAPTLKCPCCGFDVFQWGHVIADSLRFVPGSTQRSEQFNVNLFSLLTPITATWDKPLEAAVCRRCGNIQLFYPLSRD